MLFAAASRVVAVALSCLLVFTSITPGHSASSTYVIGAGDKLFVDFPLRGSPSDLQPLGGNGLTLVIVGEKVFFRYEATVAPDGSISLPSMDPVIVQGLTLIQARDAIASKLKSFSLRETVSVILHQPNSRAFVVTGGVKNPGRYVYERPTSLVEGLSIAGGPTDRAKLKFVRLYRGGHPPVTYDLRDKSLQNGLPDVMLQPSDTVVVPSRWFAPDNTVILMFLSAITAAVSIYAVLED